MITKASINARSSVEVKITFAPKEAMNYYKRVYLLARNSDTPLVRSCHILSSLSRLLTVVLLSTWTS